MDEPGFLWSDGGKIRTFVVEMRGDCFVELAAGPGRVMYCCENAAFPRLLIRQHEGPSTRLFLPVEMYSTLVR